MSEGDYLRQRRLWLKALHVGCVVTVRYKDSDYPGSVYQATKQNVWCRFTSREGGKMFYTTETHWIRFSRKTGDQWGGGMVLHIPDEKGGK